MVYSLYEVSWGMLVVVVPVFAARQFAGGAGAAVAGLLWAGLGLVGGIAALIAGHRSTAGRERKVMALGMLATAVAVWPLAAEFGLIGLVVGMMLVGAAAGPIDVGALTLRQRRTDPAELGRVPVGLDEPEHVRRPAWFRSGRRAGHVVAVGDIRRGRAGVRACRRCRRADPQVRRGGRARPDVMSARSRQAKYGRRR